MRHTLSNNAMRMVMGRALVLAMVAVLGSAAQAAEACLEHATGETLYVPSYSEVPTSERGRVQFASTLLVHNVDPQHVLTITHISYFDEDGIKIRDLIAEPVELVPFASHAAITDVTDRSGRVGANYTVEWRADTPVLPPIAEALMAGSSGTQGFALASKARVIARTGVTCQTR